MKYLHSKISDGINTTFNCVFLIGAVKVNRSIIVSNESMNDVKLVDIDFDLHMKIKLEHLIGSCVEGILRSYEQDNGRRI